MKIARRIIFWTFLIATPIIVYGLFLWGYASGELDSLESFGRTLENFDEVSTVLEISRFNGQESHIVARVVLVNGREFYYFVSENAEHEYVVQEYLDAAYVIGPRGAEQIAARTATGEILGTQLGRHAGEPIYEVQIRDANQYVHYVVIHALTGELILHFSN